MVTHLEPDILESEVMWALGSFTINKDSGGDRIPAELCKILKDDSVKVWHSIRHQIWKTQQWPQDCERSVFIPIPKKGNSKECSNYHKLHSFLMLVRLCSKSFKLGFSSTWIEKFKMYKLSLEKAEEAETKLPTFVVSYRRQGSSRKKKKSTTASLTKLKPLTVWITTNWKVLQEMGVPDHFTCLLRNLYAGQEATVRTWHGTHSGSKLGKE